MKYFVFETRKIVEWCEVLVGQHYCVVRRDGSLSDPIQRLQEAEVVQ